MKREHRKRHGKPATELIEEATHLLRTGPTSALAFYYLGSVPFVLGLLFFWADMSRNPFAHERLAIAALGLTGLFLWMKCWQVVFARKLRGFISGQHPPAWNFARIRRVFTAQAVLQPLGLFVLPVALLITLPFGWAYSFYQNLTALDDGETTRLRVLCKKSSQQSKLWPGQNHTALLVLSGFALCVWVSWALVCGMLPGLGKMLFGIESAFTRSSASLLNTTFFAAVTGLTYLSVDPIGKAFYVLRCFYGESLQSGADLKADLKEFSLRPVIVGLLLALSVAGGRSADLPDAASTPTSPESETETNGKRKPEVLSRSTSVTPPELDRAIDDVIRKNKYTWRSPRERINEPKDKEKGKFAAFLERMWNSVKGGLKSTVEWIVRWIIKLFGLNSRGNTPSTGVTWMMVQQMLLYVLALAVGIAIFFLLYRVWRNKHRKPAVIQSEAISPVPDVADENVGADQLPEDGWTRLARELLERGELRLALRAFYLASLAHLSERNLISLAKFKSNRDYERELGRRGHTFPNLLAVFGENISAFDRTWYGMHETTRDSVQQFATNVEKIKAGG